MDAQVEDHIRRNVTYNKLPQQLKQYIGSQAEYDRKILDYSIRYQLRFRGNLVRHVKKNEKLYYEELLKYSRSHFMLFPYHLSDFIVTGMRITPFQYYLQMIQDLLENERSYDTLPNFTAADCLRMLAIGRNQYIDLMNEYRPGGRRFLGVLRTGNNRDKLRDLLPSKPVRNVTIEHWWIICPGYITEQDIKNMVTSSEKAIIDDILSEGLDDDDDDRDRDAHDRDAGDGGPESAGDTGFDRSRNRSGTTSNSRKGSLISATDRLHRAGKYPEADVRSLYLKGLIYLDVPVEDDDLIVVPPLEGFIMNRVTGDYLERLLYKIFVSIDEKTHVSELADVLQIDLSLVKNAVSLYCRLGFAYKKGTEIVPPASHPSWHKVTSPHHHHHHNHANMSSSPSLSSLPPTSPTSGEFPGGPTRESNVGMSNFLAGLTDENGGDGGDHVFDEAGDNYSESESGSASVSTAAAVTSPLIGGSRTIASSMSTQSISGQPNSAKRIVFLYDSTLAAFLMMGNLSSGLKTHAVTLFEVGKLSDELIDSLMGELAKIDESDGHGEECGEAERYFINAIMLYRTLKFLRNNPALSGDLESGVGLGLDMVRCESLMALDEETCHRLLLKNYRVIISLAPLMSDCRLLTASRLPILGPPSAAVNSLWFRLFIYSLTGSGPESLLLPRGYRLRKLPRHLLVFDSLLLTPWGRDPASIPLTVALVTINETLLHSPLLIQGCVSDSRDHLAYIPFPTMSLKSSDNGLDDEEEDETEDEDRIESQYGVKCREVVQLLRSRLQLDALCGYITLVKLPDCDHHRHSNNDTGNADSGRQNSKAVDSWTLFECNFGIPLFDRDLNAEVCSRVEAHQLLTAGSLERVNAANERVKQEFDTFLAARQDDIKLSGSKFHYTFPDHINRDHASIPLPLKGWQYRNGTLEPFL